MAAVYSGERLMAQLDGARLCKFDANGYLLAWFGGHTIKVYNAAGQQVETFTRGDLEQNDADPDEIEAAMVTWIMGGWEEPN